MTFRRCVGLSVCLILLFQSLNTMADGLSVTIRQGSRGPEVTRIQEWLHLLGYMNDEPTGYFGKTTNKAVLYFQQENGLTSDGIVGNATYQMLYRQVKINLIRKHKVTARETIDSIAFKYNVTPVALREYNRLGNSGSLKTGQVLRIPPSNLASRGRGGVELTPWEEVNALFRIGSLAKISDIETGLSFFIYRRGGYNHADCEPYSPEDTAIMLAAYNNEWSWERRAVVVEFGSYRIAASMNGMPHGNCEIKENNFDGHFCLHFYGSRTHKTNRVDKDHQSKLMRAAGMFRSN